MHIVRYTPAARRRLREIYHYHADQGRRKYAKFITSELARYTDYLRKYAYIGYEDPTLSRRPLGYRTLLYNRRIKIVYYIQPGGILVTDFFDVRQDPDRVRL